MSINSASLYSSALSAIKASTNSIEKSAQKLSSGLRINSAADDAAGLAISEKMKTHIISLNQASANAQDAISFLQTADGALKQSTDIIQRMRELVVKAQNTGALSDSENTAISKELASLKEELDRIASTTTFNTKNILDGTYAENPATFQVGSTTNSADTISILIADMSSKGLASDGKAELSIDISSPEAMNETLKGLDNALDIINKQRTDLGVTENRLEYTIENLGTTVTNLEAANSRIADVDIAAEMVNYTKQAMINQVAITMLSHANTQQKSVLTLLNGL
jgi:flagellin